ncbi:MAG: choice-of-anchor D domain-containing protein, partial [Terriglobus sp.]
YTNGTSVSTGDFNHDGVTDYAFVTYNSISIRLGVTLNSNNWTTGNIQLANTEASNTFPSAVADFSGDGLPDILASNSDQSNATIYTVGGSSNTYFTSTSVNVIGSGSHAISADYSGDTVYAASTSNTLNLASGPVATSLSLTASPNPSSFGTQVTLTATLVPYSVSSLTTNGDIITFYNGSTVLGTATLNNGIAFLNLTNLPVGTTSVTARFPGDANFSPTSTTILTPVTVTAIPAPTVNPTSIDFGSVEDTTTASHTVMLTNTATGPLAIASIQASTGFSQTNNCGSSLAGAASCTITVSFAPTAPATATGTLTINTNASTPTTTVALSGTGVAPVLSLVASPNSAPTGAPVTLTATLSPYNIGSVTTNGKAVTFNNGSVSLGTGTLNNGVATLSLSSLPLGSNSITASFIGDTNFASVTSSAATATITAPPTPTVSPTSINFGTLRLNNPTTQTVSLTNTSTGPLTIASIVASSGFSQTNTCGSSIAAAASCSISVSFTATSAAAVTGTLTIATNAATPTKTVSLSGSGIASTLYLTASPASVSSGTQVALSATLTPYTNGTISTNGRSVTFASGGAILGTATLNNGTAVFTTSTLPVGSNTVTATFTGDADFTSATSNAATVIVSSTTPTAPTVTPISINFGSIALGNSVAQTVTLTNTATSPLTISAVQISGGFAQTNTCGVLAVSAFCTATVTFAPTAAGAVNGTLTFTTNAVTPTTSVSITGTGVAPVNASTGSGSLGTVKPGTNGSLPISFTTAAGVNGTLTTSCSIRLTSGGTAPVPPTCSTSPSSFNVTGGSTVSTTLTISTTTGSSAALRMPASGIALAGGLLGLLALIRRRPTLPSLLLLLLSLTALGSISGCGTSSNGSTSSGGGSGSSGSGSSSATTAGNYTVTINATIGAQTSSINLPLTIQ